MRVHIAIVRCIGVRIDLIHILEFELFNQFLHILTLQDLRLMYPPVLFLYELLLEISSQLFDDLYDETLHHFIVSFFGGGLDFTGAVWRFELFFRLVFSQGVKLVIARVFNFFIPVLISFLDAAQVCRIECFSIGRLHLLINLICDFWIQH